MESLLRLPAFQVFSGKVIRLRGYPVSRRRRQESPFSVTNIIYLVDKLRWEEQGKGGGRGVFCLWEATLLRLERDEISEVRLSVSHFTNSSQSGGKRDTGLVLGTQKRRSTRGDWGGGGNYVGVSKADKAGLFFSPPETSALVWVTFPLTASFKSTLANKLQ